jgi:cobalt/nickel transport system permease protein
VTLAASPAVAPSPLARWDARWKLTAILVACLATACLQTLFASAIALTVAAVLVAFANIFWRKFASRIGLIAFSLVPFVVVLPFLDGGTRLALTIILRALAIGTFAYLLVATVPLERTVAAAQSLGVPGVLAQIVLLAHRYTALMIDEVRRLRIAWRVRAFRTSTSRHTYRTYAHGIGAILVRSGDRGERVAAAMRARGFDGTFHLATPFHASALDALASLGLILTMIALAIWDRLA